LTLHSPNEGEAIVRIFDAAGRLLREVLRASLPSAGREIVWDGRDGSGRPVPGGLYFVLAQSGPASVTGRVAIVR
jgi:hypothetical protein